MLAERPLPGDLHQRILRLADAWATDPSIAAVYLFGSRAAGRPGPRSDVDLAVTLAPGLDAAARWRKRLDLIGDASGRVGTDAVDVVVLEGYAPYTGSREDPGRGSRDLKRPGGGPGLRLIASVELSRFAAARIQTHHAP